MTGPTLTTNMVQVDAPSKEYVEPVNALQIFCRLRPDQVDCDVSKSTTDAPKLAANGGVIKHKSDTMLALRRANSLIEQRYAFEQVFAPDCDQTTVYERVAAPLVESLLSPTGSQDALLFAYGATSSGKSYTIGGEPNQPGIIPRAIDQLFTLLDARLNKRYHIYPDTRNYYLVSNRPSDRDRQSVDLASTEQFDRALHLSAPERKRYQQSVSDWSERSHESKCLPLSATTVEHLATRRYSIFVSFVEIYNTYIYDLLEQPPASNSNGVQWRRPPHAVRHDARHTVYVVGANEMAVQTADQAMRLFLLGVHNRQTAATQLNQHSSRSHSVFTIKVVSYRDDDPVACQVDRLLDPNHLQVRQLTVVDLAGVERANRTKATGAKLAEASNINNSLLTLRSCFEVMRQNQNLDSGKQLLVPYRQHRLTYLLKSFFELGRAQIRMVVCVKPAVEDFDENVQVLSFGKKAQQITIEQHCSPELDAQQDDGNAPQELIDEINQLTSEQRKPSSSMAESVEIVLTRFKFSAEKLASAEFDSHHFVRDITDFLEQYERDFDNVVRALRKTIGQLTGALKHCPERQADRSSLKLSSYQLDLTDHFTRKLMPLRMSVHERHSSCLLGLTEIAGTPIVRHRQSAIVRSMQRRYLAGPLFEELHRALCTWEYDSIDVAAKLNVQYKALLQYTNKRGASKAPVDVFTRLYEQTPARYKFVAKQSQHQAKPTLPSTVISTQKVANLKRVFTPEDTPDTPSKLPHARTMSSKIRALANKFINNPQSTNSSRVPSSRKPTPASNVKRQLF